jgi:hypothetical protein
MRRFLLVVVAAFVLSPTAAMAELPAFNGLMSFQDIQGPEGPEDYSWELKLGEDQELRQIDETHAGVFYEDGTQAFGIEATAAHDAEGTTVPTTITVTAPNIIPLAVHHREGNPATGGAPFDYPVTAGVGWEGGFKTEAAIVLEPDRQGPPTPPTCVVPDLSNRTLRASRRILHRAHCELGRVRGERRREVRVVEQYRLVGKVLPAWTPVDVRALRPGQYSRSS